MVKIEVENTKVENTQLENTDLFQYVKSNLLVGPKKHFEEMRTLLPNVKKFACMLFEVVFLCLLFPVHGIFITSFYLWGEMELSEMMTIRQKIIFWLIVTPMGTLQLWKAVVYAGPYINIHLQ